MSAVPSSGDTEPCDHAEIDVRWTADGWICRACPRPLGRNLPPLGPKQLKRLDRLDRANDKKFGLV